MSCHPHQLVAVEFEKADQARLVGFTCGDNVWSRCVTEWILGSDVLDSMQRGTRVWLFETQDEEIVGFGSLGPWNWRWPLPNGPKNSVLLIPMLGIATQYQGKPPDPEWRFSNQILDHIIAEAKQLATASAQRPRQLLLMVHRDNLRAMKVYERFGFQLIPGAERPHDQRVMELLIED